VSEIESEANVHLQRLPALWLLVACVVAGSAACGGSSSDSSGGSACDRWKDAALRYSACNAAEVVHPTVTEECLSDEEVARLGPLPTLAACADNLSALTHDCSGLDPLREAYRKNDDNIVFDYAKKTGRHPICQCDPIDPKFRAPPSPSATTGAYQCADLLVHPDAGISD
jgi:hypothetical protein